MINHKITASDIGRIGGSATTEAKANASRENGKKGGRPLTWKIQESDQCRINSISGKTLEEAILRNLPVYAELENTSMGNLKTISDIKVKYDKDILGGKGGIRVEYIKTNTHEKTGRGEMWIFGTEADCPVEIDLGTLSREKIGFPWDSPWINKK